MGEKFLSEYLWWKLAEVEAALDAAENADVTDADLHRLRRLRDTLLEATQEESSEG